MSVSVFASQTKTDPIAIPHDPKNWIVVRKLTGRDVDLAQEADAIGMATGGPRTWATRLKRYAATGDLKAMEALAADPLVGYDRFAVIRAGLLSWSYAESIRPIAARPAVEAKDGLAAIPAVEAYDAIGDLDDETADFIAREILKLTKPALFVTAQEGQAQRKNG